MNITNVYLPYDIAKYTFYEIIYPIIIRRKKTETLIQMPSAAIHSHHRTLLDITYIQISQVSIFLLLPIEEKPLLSQVSN